jgi:hypothetical protein
MAGGFACKKGKRIRRVGDDEQNGIRRHRFDPRNHVAVNLDVLVLQAQATQRIVTIRRVAGFLVYTNRDHD